MKNAIACMSMLILADLLCPVAKGTAQQPDSQRQERLRWAIVCTEQVSATGLDDLLTVKLSDKQFQLVDRQSLSEIETEMKLAGPADTANRLSLGRILNADRLILLSQKKRDDGKTLLAIVICDCQFGTRLFVGEYEHDGLNELAESLSVVSDSIAKQFNNGIKHIVGVAPFKSTNLTYEFVPLQKTYQYQLQAGLLSLPGVAAIEIDEARAIQKEWSLDAKEHKRRVALTLVGGDFTINEGTIDLALAIQSSDQKVIRSKERLSLEEITGFLNETLPGRLVSVDSDQGQVSQFSQVQWLVAQADRFGLSGDVESACSLIEAAILLEPGNPDFRRRAIRDYIAICKSEAAGFDRLYRTNEQSDEVKRVVAARVTAWRSYLGHLEYMIRNQLISANDAVLMSGNWQTLGLSRVSRKLIWAVGDEVKQREQDFLLEMSPLVFALPRDFKTKQDALLTPNKVLTDSETWLLDAWYGYVFRSLVRDRPFDSQHIHRVITEIMPDGIPIPGEATGFFTDLSINRARRKADPESRRELNELAQKLEQSDHGNARILARFIRLKTRIAGVHVSRRAQALKPQEVQAIVDEIDRFVKDFKQTPYSTTLKNVKLNQRDRGNEMIVHMLRFDRSLLGNQLDKPKSARSKGFREPSHRRAGNPQRATPSLDGVIRQTEIEIQLKTLDGKVAPFKNQTWSKRIEGRDLNLQSPLLMMTNCGPVDVWWESGVVMVMREPGLLEEVFLDPRSEFSDVAWDGENVWVASKQKGLRILDPLGKQWIAESPENLPPAEHAMKIIPIGPGEVLAVGSFGKDYRAWCAVVSRREGVLSCDVFHEATNVMRDEDPDWSDSQMVFRPLWIANYQPANETTRKFLVSRAPGDTFAAFRAMNFHKPLLVDIENREVTVFDRELYVSGVPVRHDHRDSFFSHNGDLFRCANSFVYHQPENYDQSSRRHPGQSAAIHFEYIQYFGDRICDTTQRARNRRGRQPLSEMNRFIKDGDDLIVPGVEWIKLDPQTLEEVRFGSPDTGSPDTESVLDVPLRYGKSAHYGYLGWNIEFRHSSPRHRKPATFFKYELELFER